MLAPSIINFFLLLLVDDRMLESKFGTSIFIVADKSSHQALSHVLVFETGQVEIGL